MAPRRITLASTHKTSLKLVNICDRIFINRLNDIIIYALSIFMWTLAEKNFAIIRYHMLIQFTNRIIIFYIDNRFSQTLMLRVSFLFIIIIRDYPISMIKRKMWRLLDLSTYLWWKIMPDFQLLDLTERLLELGFIVYDYQISYF